MARFRTYKNGIYGHRYKQYYIIKNDKKDFTIIDEGKNVVETGFENFWDCQWHIDKIVASPNLQQLMKSLYDEDIYTLSRFYVDLTEKSNKEGLNEQESELLYWVTKIRNRKADDKPY